MQNLELSNIRTSYKSNELNQSQRTREPVFYPSLALHHTWHKPPDFASQLYPPQRHRPPSSRRQTICSSRPCTRPNRHTNRRPPLAIMPIVLLRREPFTPLNDGLDARRSISSCHRLSYRGARTDRSPGIKGVVERNEVPVEEAEGFRGWGQFGEPERDGGLGRWTK